MSKLADSLILRFKNAGVKVTDLRSVLPRRGQIGFRPLKSISIIAIHHDADRRTHSYDSIARYRQQAFYHINKDWGGGYHGDGLMYAMRIDNVGELFITRDLEELLWHISDKNYVGVGICLDGTLGDGCTREQAETLQKVLDVLCYQTPEIPASQKNVLGHKEIPSNNTACPGDYMDAVISYRVARNIYPERYKYEYPPQAPVPPVAPPVPPTPPKPEYEAMLFKLVAPVTKYAVRDGVELVSFTDDKVLKTYSKGQVFLGLPYTTSFNGQQYYVTQWSLDHGVWQGIRVLDLVDTNPVVIPPKPVPTEPEPQPEPVEPTPQEPEQPKPSTNFFDILIKEITESIIKIIKRIWR